MRLLYFLLPLCLAGSSLAGEKINVLFLIADDLRNELGCYGSEVAITPHLDALAESGMRFDRAYCQKAVCWPSRNSLLSGLMPDNLGKANAKDTFRVSHPEITSMPEWFRQNGWHTASFGKILHNGQDDPPSWSQPHYDPPPLHYASPGNRGKHPIINRYDPGNKANPLFESADVPDEAYKDGLTARAAITEIQKRSREEKPFFLMVGFHKPHSPFNAPKRDWDLYDRENVPLSPIPNLPKGAPLKHSFHESRYIRSFTDFPDAGPIPDDVARETRHAYLACVSYIDRLTGQILAALEETGQRENTLIVFTSDHGYHLGDHALWSKHTTFEIATRVPLLMAGPGIEAGSTTESLVELVDLFPTLAEKADLALPSHLDGKSFATVLSDPLLTIRESAFSEFSRGGARGCSIRTKRFRYTEWRNLKNKKVTARELYDHETDPMETANVVMEGTYKSDRSRLSALLRGRLSPTAP
ncbi:MAG: sulfatase [Verrucomicrobiales bacterium]|nr:sulfatase [Verrucomicrobiales bacterium]